jgi:hypothetical protein
MPTEIGTAIVTAIVETTAVPKMNASAPNLPWLGAHSFEVTKLRPASRKAGQALLTVVTAMRTRMTRIVSPAARVR